MTQTRRKILMKVFGQDMNAHYTCDYKHEYEKIGTCSQRRKIAYFKELDKRLASHYYALHTQKGMIIDQQSQALYTNILLHFSLHFIPAWRQPPSQVVLLLRLRTRHRPSRRPSTARGPPIGRMVRPRPASSFRSSIWRRS